jgi:glycosyltransferase involved in cell wall biosynthesis
MASPFVSVIVRSYHRPQALLELLERLRTQRYAAFEIVVCEQSEDPELVDRVHGLRDSRIRLLVTPPLGCGGARNQGILHSRGDILIFIDDDDLPVDDNWLAAHAANFADPLCQGVSGRQVAHLDEAGNRRTTAKALRRAMTFTFWKDGNCYTWLGARKQGIDSLHGTNCSLRRSAFDRAGGWDENFTVGEEHSFYHRWNRQRRAGEYFVHDPEPTIWRRYDVEGGCERRTIALWDFRELDAQMRAYVRIIGYYFPVRFWALLPLYMVRMWLRTIDWAFDKDTRHIPFARRLLACGVITLSLPISFFRHAVLRVGAPVRRMAKLPERRSETVTSGQEAVLA